MLSIEQLGFIIALIMTLIIIVGSMILYILFGIPAVILFYVVIAAALGVLMIITRYIKDS